MKKPLVIVAILAVLAAILEFTPLKNVANQELQRRADALTEQVVARGAIRTSVTVNEAQTLVTYNKEGDMPGEYHQASAEYSRLLHIYDKRLPVKK